MTAAFPLGAFATLDTETNAKDPEQARLLEICLALVVPGRETDVRTTLVDPGDGVEIPAEATEVNGLTIERVRSEGKPAADVLDLWVGDTALAIQSGLPLVIQNAPYDTTVLDRECRRHGVPTLSDRLGGVIAPVLDPGVLDKQCIKYRKRVSDKQGARVLKTLAAVYGIPWDDEKAHGAEYDAMQGGRVVWRIGQWACLSHAELMALQLGPFTPPKPMHRNDAGKFQALARMSLAELHDAQIGWYAEQSESLGDYWRKEAHKAAQRAEWAAERFDASDDPAVRAEADEERMAAEMEVADLEGRIASLSPHWPVKPYEAVSAS